MALTEQVYNIIQYIAPSLILVLWLFFLLFSERGPTPMTLFISIVLPFYMDFTFFTIFVNFRNLSGNSHIRKWS